MSKFKFGNMHTGKWETYIEMAARHAKQVLDNAAELRYEGEGLNTSYWEKRFADVVDTMNHGGEGDPGQGYPGVEHSAEGHFAGEHRKYDVPRGYTTYQLFVVYDGSTATQYPWLFTLRKGDIDWESASLDPNGDTAHQVALKWWRAFVISRMFEHVRRGAALQAVLKDCYQLVFLE